MCASLHREIGVRTDGCNRQVPFSKKAPPKFTARVGMLLELSFAKRMPRIGRWRENTKSIAGLTLNLLIRNQ